MAIARHSALPEPAHEAERTCAAIASGLIGDTPKWWLERIVERARMVLSAPMAAVTAVIGDRTHVVAAGGFAPMVGPRSASFCAHTIIAPDRILCVPDAMADPRFATNPFVAGPPHLRFYAGAPLVTRDGYAVGALCVFGLKPRASLVHFEALTLIELAGEISARL